MKSPSFVALVVSVSATVLLPLVSPAADMASAADRTFIAKVSQGGMFEVALGKFAATHGSTQDIRDQGNTEARDHTLVGAKLKAVSGDAGVTFPSTLNAMFAVQITALEALSGGKFDAAYLKAMEDIHAKDGAAFAKEASDGTDTKLRAFAGETHRIVLRHIGELGALGP